FDVDAVSFPGPLLVSLFHEAGAAATPRCPCLSYKEGLLVGSCTRRMVSSTADNHEAETKAQHELVLQQFITTGGRCSFYDGLGGVAQEKLKGATKQLERWAGFFVVRRGGGMRPSLRELEVYRNMRALPGVPHSFVLLLLTITIAPGSNTQSFKYYCLAEDLSGKLKPLPCRVRNLLHDSATDFGRFYPTPLPPDLVSKAKECGLTDAYSGDMPPHLVQQEDLFKATMTSLQEALQEVAAAEARVRQLQAEEASLQEALGGTQMMAE
ncbi:hypothetical protein JKP88DRAFT_312273, partial [Tribonema minus]